MNEVPALPPPKIKDRRTSLIVFGILQILLGCLCLLMTAAMVFGQAMVARTSGNPMDIRGIYVYWFVADNKLTASHDSRMWSMAKNLLETGTLERWAYISYFSRCFPGQEEATFKRLEEFIVKSAPEFQIPAGKPSSNSAGKIQTAFK